MRAAALVALPAPRPRGADEYRRQARRLRATMRGQPGRLHRKLRELADRQDAPAAGSSMEKPAVATGVVTRDRRASAFAEEVAARMDGPVLRYSQRRALLALARRVGVGRFEANLIIAAVQHRRVAEDGTRRPLPDAPRWKLGAVAPLLVVLAVESLVAVGIWRVCGLDGM
jgi:hypothetical protein